MPGCTSHVTSPDQTAGRQTSSRCTDGRFGKMKEQRKIGPMREGLKSWKAERKLVFESATDENEPPRKCQTRGLEVKCNSSNITLVHTKSLNRVRKSANLNRIS